MDALKRGVSDSNNHIPKMATCFTRKYRFGTPMPRFRAWLNYKHVFRGCTSTTFEAFQSPSTTRIFKNPEFGSIRVIEENGKYLFCGLDIVTALGYAKPRNAINSHCRYALKRGVPHPQNPECNIDMTFIPEGDLYRLIVHSKLPSAERFERWVFDEVLPTIRKTGGYVDENRSDLFLDICKCDTKRA